MTKSKFKVGDRVYAPYHGCGTVTAILSNTVYPIEVTWDDDRWENEGTSTFTSDGRLSRYIDKDDTTLIVVDEGSVGEERKFKVGDKVFFPYHGLGVVAELHDDGRNYPLDVEWLEKPYEHGITPFTKDGFLTKRYTEGADQLTVVERASEKGEREVEEELRVGDWVWLNPNEKGIITFIYPNKETCIVDSELDGEVEAVMAGLTKVDYSPINPSHYQVAGIPEAIDIMKHLMTQEQFKGFLWGNIIKYAYRYGRKGDEHDTAGKIEWYANRLKEVCAEEKKEQERE